MLKKMRWRFVGAAMTAFFAVVMIILCTVNLWNYHITTDRQNSTLEMLVDFDINRKTPFEDDDYSVPGPFGGTSPEAQYMLRFFAVHCDADGEVTSIDKEYIASVSVEKAREYASKVLEKANEFGYCDGYRYVVRETDEGTTIVFLNSEREIQYMKTLLLVSCLVAAFGLVAVFVLIAAFSKRAIMPYVRNMEIQKQFITDAGHELKTPLTSIAASAEVLAMEQEDNEWVQNIQRQTVRLSKLVSNLVTLSRLDEENPFPDMMNFSLSDAVWEIAEPFSALAKAKGKIYEQSIADGLMLYGDRSAVQQMVSILLDNAVRYSNEGGKIRLNVYEKQRNKVIEVYNTCVFDHIEDLDRLFDRFYRPDKARSVSSGGTGIGLSIARAAAEAHNGKIFAESFDGKGITFKIVL